MLTTYKRHSLFIHTSKFKEIKNSKEFNLLYFNAGKTRGNHFHPEFTEYFAVIEGTIALFTIDPKTDEVINMLCGEGTVFKSAPKVPHAIIAITPAKCMSLITKPWDECAIPIVYENLSTHS